MNTTSSFMKAPSVMWKVVLGLMLAGQFMAAQGQPLITSQPTNQTILLGANATFSVTVSDGSPVTYLWQFNGSNVLNQIVTIAGTGNNTYSGDNGPATSAAFKWPAGRLR